MQSVRRMRSMARSCSRTASCRLNALMMRIADVVCCITETDRPARL
jgi:hypothetical protein